MDNPAPDRDASVKSLGIFLNNKKKKRKRIQKGHLENQIIYRISGDRFVIKDTKKEA